MNLIVSVDVNLDNGSNVFVPRVPVHVDDAVYNEYVANVSTWGVDDVETIAMVECIRNEIGIPDVVWDTLPDQDEYDYVIEVVEEN